MRYIVDRIEGRVAVCETEELSTVVFPLEHLPDGTHEGAVLIEKNGAFVFDESEEAQRRSEIFDLQNSLFED